MFERLFCITFADGTEKYEEDNSPSREEGRNLVEQKYLNAARINCVAEQQANIPVRDPKYWEAGYGPPID